MDFTFTPTETKADIPYFEEATASYAPYYSSNKSIANAKQEITDEMTKLGAAVLIIQEGFFGNKPKRYGYQIKFNWQGAPGLLRVAGLPIKARETDRKIQRVRVQALLNVRDWLKASVTQSIFSPGSHPLMMNLLVDGQQTVADQIMQSGRLALPEPDDIVEGEFSPK